MRNNAYPCLLRGERERERKMVAAEMELATIDREAEQQNWSSDYVANISVENAENSMRDFFHSIAYASSFSSVDLFSLFALFHSFICMTCLHLVTNVITVWHRWMFSSSSFVCRPSQFAFCSCNDEINLWHEMIRNKVKPNKCCCRCCCCFFFLLSWKLHQRKVALPHNNNSTNKMRKKYI